MIKNLIIALMSAALLIFVLYNIGCFENTNWTGRDERSIHVAKRTKTVRKSPVFLIGSVYSSKDLPAAESVRGAQIASEILRSEGKNIQYITVANCHRQPETAREIQKLCSDYKVGAILGPGNSEMLPSLRALTQFHGMPLISAITVRPEKLPVLEKENYVSFFPPLEKWVHAILTHMKNNNDRRILILSPGSGTYGEIFSSVLERNAKDFLGEFKIYRMSYPQPLRASYFRNSMTNYVGQHQVDAVFFGGTENDLPELIELLKIHDLKLPVYVSDDITLKDIPANIKIESLYLPEAEVPVSNPQLLKLYRERYKTAPSYHAVLGGETLFALFEKADKVNYTPDALVQTMERSSKILNQKIKIKTVKFSPTGL